MNGPLKISEATSLALHSLALLAGDQGRHLSTKELAGQLAASEAHLSKIMQRMHKMGLVNSFRGPGGGFALAQPPERIKLIDVYEEFEGPVSTAGCLLDQNVCTGGICLLGGVLGDISKQFVNYLKQTNLSEINGGIGGCIHD